MSTTTVAVVLAGGEGQRMGGAKPLRALGRTTLLANAIRLAHAYCPLVAVSVRGPDQAPGVVEPLVHDIAEVEGPLAGLAAALAFTQAQGARQALTLPCDMPRLPADLLARLEAGLTEAGPLAAIAESGGQLHPVCGLWRVESAERLEAYLASGRRSLKGFAAACGFVAVTWDATPDPFANANTPEELAGLQPSAGSSSGPG